MASGRCFVTAPESACNCSDPLLERVQLRPRRRALIPRRRVALDRAGDRVAMRTRRPMNRALRALLDEVQPSDLSPLLHADHTLLLARSQDQARVRDQPDDLRLGARWSSFQPAQVVQYSGGAIQAAPTTRPISARAPEFRHCVTRRVVVPRMPSLIGLTSLLSRVCASAQPVGARPIRGAAFGRREVCRPSAQETRKSLRAGKARMRATAR
jgi:hypothetical protein